MTMPSITSESSPAPAAEDVTQNGKSMVDDASNGHSLAEIATELDFATWYDGVEGELLNASHDDYQYVAVSCSISRLHADPHSKFTEIILTSWRSPKHT